MKESIGRAASTPSRKVANRDASIRIPREAEASDRKLRALTHAACMTSPRLFMLFSPEVHADDE